MPSDFTTDQMCEALKEMQTVPTWEWARMLDVVYSGCWILNPVASDASARLIWGRNLAMQLRMNAQHNILNLR